jgi:predicted choloylglycine hydrolase
METTNQIEKALEKKVNAEIEEIVEQFTNACKALGSKYGAHVFQDLKHKDSSITTLRPEEFKNIIFNSLQKKYGPSMLKKKSEELIAKLDLI